MPRGAAVVRMTLFASLLLALWSLAVRGHPTHQSWAEIAAPVYAGALLIAVVWRPRTTGLTIATAVAAAGSVALPLVFLLVRRLGQPEVWVVQDGARHMLVAGTPYLHSPESLAEFRPYLPLMFAFGALPGRWGDPRVSATILLLIVLVSLVLRQRRATGEADAFRLGQSLSLLIAFPLIAQAVATSFIDVPQAALTITALLLLSKDRFGSSGFVVGLTLALKPTALCGLFVLALSSSARGGQSAAARFISVAVITAAACLMPVAAIDPRAMWTNAVLFPLGLTDVESPAASPLPGVLMRQSGLPTSVSVVVLIVAAIVYSTWCVRTRTPDVIRTAGQLAGGLTLAFLLLPYSRVGYFVLPALCWLPILLARPRSRAGSR